MNYFVFQKAWDLDQSYYIQTMAGFDKAVPKNGEFFHEYVLTITIEILHYERDVFAQVMYFILPTTIKYQKKKC